MSDISSLTQPAACIDEAIHLYRSSSSSWQNATDYLYASQSNRIASISQITDPGIRLSSVHTLPQNFSSQFRNVQYRSFMGLFSEIRRAWLTIDNKLFLWAYPSSEACVNTPQAPAYSDLYVFEGITDVIMSVALVRPRPHIFDESIEHLIAVATSVQVTLLAVSFSPSGEISLLPTSVSVATDGVLMLKLASTVDGRVFMAGEDGLLHELRYESSGLGGVFGVFTSRSTRVRKLVHSNSSIPLASYIRSLFRKDDELVDLAIDASRSVLYTLSQGGFLSVYDISHPNKTRIAASVNVAHESRNLVSFSVPSGEREYVSIHAVESNLSSTVHLIVVTSYGERIYFSSAPGSSSSSSDPGTFHDPSRSTRQRVSNVGPKSLTCVGYRPSPDRLISRSSHPCIHIALCDRGTFVFADLRENESDRLICVYPDLGLSSSPGSQGTRPGASQIAEVVFETTLDIDNGVSIDRPDHNTPFTMSSPGNLGASPDRSRQEDLKRTFAIAAAEEFAASFGRVSDSSPTQPPKLFWVLTSSAIHLYERVQPVDRLLEIFVLENASSSELESFFKRYGAAEACAMCIEIAISYPAVFTVAANTFHKFGGDPQFDHRQTLLEPSSRNRMDRGTQRRSSIFSGAVAATGGSINGPNRPVFDVGRPSLQLSPLSRFSGAHEGTCIFLARTLHPMWSEYLMSSRNPDGYQTFSFSNEMINATRNRLIDLIAFLNNYAPDPVMPDYQNMWTDDGREQNTAGQRNLRYNGLDANVEMEDVNEASDYENRGIRNNAARGVHTIQRDGGASRMESNLIVALKNLCMRVVEVLALLLILENHQVHRIVTLLQPEKQAKLVNIKLRDLVVPEEGDVMASSLIEALFCTYSDGQRAVEGVGRILKDRCGSFFGDSDAELHRGLVKLREAVTCLSDADQYGFDNASMQDDVYDIQNRWESSETDKESAIRRAQNLGEEAARILKSVSQRIHDIASICNDLRQVRALPSLVDLALSVGKVAETDGNRNRAIAAYDAILEALMPLVRGEEPAVGQLGVAGRDEQLMKAAMRVAMNSQSETFLRKLYDFLLQSKSGEDALLSHSSPSIEGYLEEKRELNLLWRYSAKHEQYLEAAGVLLNLAESKEELPLVDRINYLSCALHNAKTAASRGDNRAASVLVEIKDYLDVAKVQIHVREELLAQHNRNENIDKALKELDGPILGLSELFNKYARPFELHEASLEVFRCGSYRDDAYVRELWAKIVERKAAELNTPNLLSQGLIKVGRQLYPSDVAFPTAYIIDVLERLSYSNRSKVGWRDSGDWVISTMKGIGVPLSDLMDGYRTMIENLQQSMNMYEEWSWTEENAQLHILQAMERVMALWSSENVAPELNRSSGMELCRRSLISEADRALRAVTLCKSRLRGMSTTMGRTLVQKFDALEKKITPLVH